VILDLVNSDFIIRIKGAANLKGSKINVCRKQERNMMTALCGTNSHRMKEAGRKWKRRRW
jgi:hypothetical protein